MEKKSLKHFLISYRDLISVFVIALLLGGVVLTMQLSKSQQTFQSGAFTNGVMLSMQTQKQNISSGEVFTVNFAMDTKDLKVTAADLRINYSPNAFELVSFSLPSDALLPEILGPGPVDSSGKKIADTSMPGKIIVQIGSGTTAKSGVGTLAVVTLRAKNTVSTGEVSYDNMTQVAALTYSISVIESMESLPPFSISSTLISTTPTTTAVSITPAINNLVVQIVQPLDGAVVPRSGFIPIVATVSTAIESANIQIYFDNNLIYTCNKTLTCNYNLRARKLSPGQHTIKATATDTSGNTGSTSVKVIQEAK